MSRARPIETYPTQQYVGLVNRVLSTGTPFLVPCTKTQAASLRGELYAWRRACEASPGDANVLGIPVARLRELAWRINDQGLETILATDLQGPGLIEKALGGTDPVRTQAQAALAGLMGKLKEGGDGSES